MRIIEANQIPDGTGIAPNIFNLPCVTSAYKTMQGGVRYRVETPYDSQVAKSTDWICKYEDGHWDVLSDKEYKENK